MSSFSFVKKTDKIERVDIESLFEKDEKRMNETIKLFNGAINKIYSQIKEHANLNARFIRFTIPTDILKNRKLVEQFKIFALNEFTKNKFNLYWESQISGIISWNEYVPKYFREYIYNTQNIKINERGEIEPSDEELERENQLKKQQEENEIINRKNKSKFESLDKYIPTGTFYYDELQKLQERLENDNNQI